MFYHRAAQFVLGIVLILCSVCSFAFVEIPPLNRHITDLIGLITKEQANDLEEQLVAYREKTGCEIAVLLIDNTEPESIDQYSIRVVDEWKLGQKGIDNGVLLIVAPNNPVALRRFRIEVGRGAEDVLTDITSNRILQDVIAPYFRKNDFYGGLKAGLTSIIQTLDQKEFTAPTNTKTSNSDSSFEILFFLILIIWLFFSFVHRKKSRSNGIVLGKNYSYYDDLPRYSSTHIPGTRSNSSSSDFSGGGGFSGGGASGNW